MPLPTAERTGQAGRDEDNEGKLGPRQLRAKLRAETALRRSEGGSTPPKDDQDDASHLTTCRPLKRPRTDTAQSGPDASLSATSRSAFRQVTNPSFIDSYRVTGLHPRAHVYYCPHFVNAELAEDWKTRLLTEAAWYRPTLRVYGRDVIQSRQIAAYATTSDLKLTYSGHPVEMHHPFPPLLNEIASHLTQVIGSDVHFNHVMLNLYEDGSRYIGRHRDNRENLVIASISLGSERRWIMERAKTRRTAKKGGSGGGLIHFVGWQDQGEGQIPDRKEWTLGSGSLLVMQGDTQELYTHEIPKEPKIKDFRISLTFRQLIDKEEPASRRRAKA